MTLHSFDPMIAKDVGVSAAVIYQNIIFWTQKNKANRRNIRDGYVWTYNSRRAFAELFPYLTDKQVRTALDKLVDFGLLVRGNYNKMTMDKTSWYAPACSKDWLCTIGPDGPMDWTAEANGLDPEGQAIPDSKPDIKPINKPSPLPPKGGRGRGGRKDIMDEVMEILAKKRANNGWA
jgi:hypothetical protein